MILVQYNEWLVSDVDTDGLVLLHQGISSHSTDYAPKHLPVFNLLPPGRFQFNFM